MVSWLSQARQSVTYPETYLRTLSRHDVDMHAEIRTRCGVNERFDYVPAHEKLPGQLNSFTNLIRRSSYLVSQRLDLPYQTYMYARAHWNC
jgi:hypothetical protein